MITCRFDRCVSLNLCQTTRETRKLLDRNLDPPTANGSIRNLMINMKVSICKRTNHLYTLEEVGTETRRRLVVPKFCSRNVIDIVHHSLGHLTQTQFLAEIKRLFLFVGGNNDEGKSLRAQVAERTNKCPGCVNLKPTKKDDRPTKEVPIPSRINEMIFVDEFSRQSIQNQTWNFAMASEGLTRMSKLYPYRGPMTEKKFVQILEKIKNDFLFYEPKGHVCEVKILSDRLSSHVKASQNPKLAEKGMKIECFKPKSKSPNKIPELDGRLSKISRFLRQEMTSPNVSIEQAAFAAANKYNSTISAEGHKPVELFTGRRSFSPDTFKVDVDALRQAIASGRKASRQSVDKVQGKDNFVRKDFVPYVKGSADDYDSREYVPIKLGDLITIKGPFDKNELRSWYDVSKHDICPKGINFDDSVVYCRKVGAAARSSNLFCFHFDVVANVIDGDSNESILYRQDVKKNRLNSMSHIHLNWTMFRQGRPFTLKEGIDSPYHNFDYDGNWASDMIELPTVDQSTHFQSRNQLMKDYTSLDDYKSEMRTNQKVLSNQRRNALSDSEAEKIKKMVQEKGLSKSKPKNRELEALQRDPHSIIISKLSDSPARSTRSQKLSKKF